MGLTHVAPVNEYIIIDLKVEFSGLFFSSLRQNNKPVVSQRGHYNDNTMTDTAKYFERVGNSNIDGSYWNCRTMSYIYIHTVR